MLMRKGAPTIKTTVRLGKAILQEFGAKDGLKVMEWLMLLIAAWGKVSPAELAQIEREVKRS